MPETPPSFLTEQLKEELTRLYNGPGRHYHTRDHVDAMLRYLELHRSNIAHPEAVEAAIWFHDAIYDSHAKDNETKSAELAVERLAGLVEPSQLDFVRTLIEATEKHTVPHLTDPASVGDAELFLDMDLSILGTEESTFDNYEAAVRQEYAWADDAAWRKGRTAALKAFLDRPQVFFSQTFHQQYEETARRNLKRSIEKLTSLEDSQV